MCLYPKLIQNPKYKPNAKNNQNPPIIQDVRVKYVPIGCGLCIECQKQRANQWRTRLSEDIKTNADAKFVTLTFSNENYKLLAEKHNNLKGYLLDYAIATYAVRHFLERHRKKYKKSIRHWLITELGHKGTENLHLHGILWKQDISDINEIWQYGYTWAGYNVNNKNENYVEALS